MHLNFLSKSIASLEHPDRNEDAVAYNAKGGWAAILDGVGGTTAGKEASNKALEVIKLRLTNWHKDDDLRVEEKLKSVIEEASLAVSKNVPDGLTTVVVSKILRIGEETMIFTASVGDSRSYLFRKETLIQITQDDSVIPQRLAQKLDNVASIDELNDLEVKGFNLRNIVTQVLGQEEPLEVHIYPVIMKAGDKYIFCTDGVHDNLTFGEMEKLVAKKGDVAKLLVEKARRRSKENHLRSKPDDISAVVCKVS